jgi:Cellulose biosynthesis protein BcsS
MTHANAAFRAVAALLFVVLAPQLGQAQQTSPSTADIGTIDGVTLSTTDGATLSMPAGVRKSSVTRSRDRSPSTKDSNDSEEPTERGYWYTGYDVVRGSQYAYSGGSVALNGDLSKNGFHVRLYGSWVGYDLNPGHGNGYQTDLMLGYRISTEKLDAGLYIGADYQNYRLRPDDPTSEVRGTEWGFKVAGDLASPREGNLFYYALTGNYSTSFHTYWARARVGATLHGFTFGPEGIVDGDVGFDAQRVGGFLIFELKLFPNMSPLEVGLDVGHQFVSHTNGGVAGGIGGGAGTYGGIVLSVTF